MQRADILLFVLDVRSLVCRNWGCVVEYGGHLFCLNEKGVSACSHWTDKNVGPNTSAVLTLSLTETYCLSYLVCGVIVISGVFSLWGVIRKCLCGDPGAVSVSLCWPVESGKVLK
jgi:hypothetical protein